MINLNKPCEGLDYTIEPLENIDNTQGWIVVIKTGVYKNTTFLYTNVEYNGKRGNIRFRLDAIDNTQNSLSVDSNLEDYAFEVLQDIIRNGLANGSIVLDDKDSDYGSVARE